MLARAFAAEVPAAWVVGDEVYGNDGDLRRWLEREGRPYVLGVARSHALWRGGEQVRAEALLSEVPAAAWARVEVAPSSKGPRVYAWARARLPYLAADGWAQWLLLRRSLAEPAEVAYYQAYGPEGTPLEELARAAGTRWAIEEGFARAKGEVGLDHYEVRRWDAWHRHVTLCLLAHAFLEVTRADATAGAAKRGRPTG